MKRKPQTGTLVEIHLSNTRFCYGQVLDKASIAFFDIQHKQDNVSNILSSSVIFIVAAYNSAFKRDNWTSCGRYEIPPKLVELPYQYIQDAIDPSKFELYDPNNGNIQPATRQDCEGLECAAVWEAEHIEDRLNDYFDGKENAWLKSLEIK